MVTFDKGRNTKIQNEYVNELFHIYFKNALSIVSGVVIHVSDVNGPIGEIDKALLLLRKFIRFYIGQLDKLWSGVFRCESYILGSFGGESVFVEAKFDLRCDKSISNYVFLSI